MVRLSHGLLARAVITMSVVWSAAEPCALAASPQSPPAASATAGRASEAFDARRYERARLLFEQAISEARAGRDLPTEALAERGLGLTLIKQAHYDEARRALQASLQAFEALGDLSGAGWALHDLGWLAWQNFIGEAPDSFWSRGLEKVLAAGDRSAEAQLRADRAAAMRPGPDSIAAYGHALQLARELGATRTVGEALYGLGRHQYWTGRFADALQSFEEARRIFVQIGARDWEADVFLELGRLYEKHGSLEQARDSYRRGLAIIRILGDKPRAALALGAIVSMHRAAGQLAQAAAAARQLVALRQTMDAARAVNLERLRLAWIYVEMRRPREALPLIDAVMRGPDALSRSLGYPPLAETYLGLGDYKRALDASDEGIRLLRETADRPFLLATRARASDKLGDRASALTDLDAALAQVEDARTQLAPSDLMRQGYGERLLRVFEFAIELRMRAGRGEAALEAAEQARARAFLDLLAARAAPDITKAASDVLRAPTATPASIDQLKTTAARLGSSIVSYWVAPAETFIWVVGADGRVTSTTVPVSARHLAVLIERTAADIGVAGPPAAEPWRELYETLLRPVEHALPSARGQLLTIVPHGPLFRLSFAALLDRRRTYLIERYRLHYVPSGGALLYLPRPRSSHGRGRYLIVADPAGTGSPTQATLAPLPGALREMSAIVDMLPAGTTTTLSGSRATEERLRGLLPGQAVVHLATHGRLSDRSETQSFLMLSGHGTNPANDGRLTTGEIYDLKLDADLVVLSACRSGRGPVTGDGVLGMTRAFLHAGAPSIVATLWDVADRSGAELMPAFYRHWREGADKSAALRDAQLELIARLRAGRVTIDTPGGLRTLPEHPFLWAPYVLVGET